MDIECVINLVQMYGSRDKTLTEYEMLAYESACNLLKRFFDSQLVSPDDFVDQSDPPQDIGSQIN